MPENNTSTENRGDNSTIGKLSSAATDMKDKVTDLGRSAAEKLDIDRDTAAGGIDKAASALHGTAENLPGGEKVAHLAHATADKLSATAEYVRSHDANRMMSDVETLVKNNPGPSLIAAAVVGFLVARAFSND